VCRNNIDELATDDFLGKLIDRGVHYMWYYVYRPVGRDPAPELCLDREQIIRLRRFMVDARPRFPILIVDAYWDDRGRALCPAAAGISHHINPWGDVEPCPVVQFAADNVCDGGDLYGAVNGSTFLRGFSDLVAQTTRGCILMERPDRMREFMLQQGARDTSGRGTGFDQLASSCCRSSHDMAGAEIPERHWLYRLAKRHWFAGFGTYG
jgi:hypothetical protein